MIQNFSLLIFTIFTGILDRPSRTTLHEKTPYISVKIEQAHPPEIDFERGPKWFLRCMHPSRRENAVHFSEN